MVTSSHQYCIVRKNQIPGVKTAIILSGDKYIAIYHPSPVAPLAQAVLVQVSGSGILQTWLVHERH